LRLKNKLDDELFSSIVSNTPLVSIDLVVRNSEGMILLGQRTNRPALGKWFVPGGRIYKDESISDAFFRLTQEELGMDIPLNDGKFIGVYEHFYPDNYSGEAFSTHYVVLGYQLELDVSLNKLPQIQHDHYRWWERKDVMDSEEVHLHSRWYLDASRGIKNNGNGK